MRVQIPPCSFKVIVMNKLRHVMANLELAANLMETAIACEQEEIKAYAWEQSEILDDLIYFELR